MKIPQTVELTPLTTPEGALAAYGPGEKPILSLKDWRRMFRDQQVAFRLAREICIRWQGDNGAAAVPVQVLFPKVAFAAKRFLAEKLDRKGASEPCDILLVGEYTGIPPMNGHLGRHGGTVATKPGVRQR
jgi:type III restriction enzyme